MAYDCQGYKKLKNFFNGDNAAGKAGVAHIPHAAAGFGYAALVHDELHNVALAVLVQRISVRVAFDVAGDSHKGAAALQGYAEALAHALGVIGAKGHHITAVVNAEALLIRVGLLLEGVLAGAGIGQHAIIHIGFEAGVGAVGRGDGQRGGCRLRRFCWGGLSRFSGRGGLWCWLCRFGCLGGLICWRRLRQRDWRGWANVCLGIDRRQAQFEGLLLFRLSAEAAGVAWAKLRQGRVGESRTAGED